MPDPTPTAPEDPFLARLVKSGVIERVVTILVSAALGAFAGGATHTVEDANHVATTEKNRERTLEIGSDLNDTKTAFVRYTDARVKEEELERERQERELRDMVVMLKAQVRALERRR